MTQYNTQVDQNCITYTVSVLFIGCKDVISVADNPKMDYPSCPGTVHKSITRPVLHRDKIERLCGVYNKPHTILRFHQ